MTAAGTPIRRRRARRWGWGTLIGLALLSGALVLGGFVLMGRTITAPDWLERQVEARAAAAGLNVQFDTMEVVVHKGWRPRVRLTGLDLATAEGAPLFSVGIAEAALAMQPLLRGEVQPLEIEISGLFAALIRDAEGTLSLSGGEGLARAAPSMPELIEGLDAVLMDPRLAGLRSAELFGLTLSFEDRRAGRAWTADGGRARMEIDGDTLALSADLALLGGGAGIATLEANYASVIGRPAATFGLRLRDVPSTDIATQSPAFAWLDALEAPISGALRSGVGADGTLAPLSATLQIGAGALQPNAQTRPIPFEAAQSYFTYDSEQGVMRFDALSVQSEWLTASAEGTATLNAGAAGTLTDLIGQFRLQDVQFNPFQLYAQPVILSGASLDFRLALDPFEITLGQGIMRDQGQVLNASGALRAEQDGWRFALDARMDALDRARLLALWPERLVPRTRAWIAENLTGGTLKAIDLAMRGAPRQTAETYLSFDFADAQVRYAKPLPPIEGGSGNASLLRDRFVVTLDEGQVAAPAGGQIDMAGSSFIIPDVTVDGGPPAVARLQTRGSITAALSLLDLAPLNIMERAGLPVDLAAGTAELNGTLALPLRRDLRLAEVQFDAAGTLRGVASDTLLPGQSFNAEALQVSARNDGVRIGGAGTLSGVPFDAAWTQPLGDEAAGGGRIDGTVELSRRTIETFELGLPAELIGGQGTGAFSVSLPRGGPPKLDLRSDLAGLDMGLSAIGWRKGPGQAGALQLDATLGPAPQVDRLSLRAAGLEATGQIAVTDSGTLARAVFDRVRLGGWLDAPVTLVGRGAGAAPEIRLQGGQIDLRSAAFSAAGADAGQGASGPLSLVLNRLQIADTIAITDMQGDFITARGLDGRFTGRINGGAAIEGQVVPQNGRTAIRIRSSDAGGVFASAGIIRQARGGTLDLTLLPVGGEGTFDGTLRVTDTRVKDAPAIADLLSAISIVGLLEQLSGEGILFTEVDAAFRLTPSVLTLTRASAAGPSMGLSMDGRYGIEGGRMDMQGVISPVYFLNGIGQIFTRKGEGLIGFAYRLTGDAADPRVSVNPLSALTPGLFREIFRRPPPAVPDAGAAPRAFVPPDAPVPEAPPRAPQAERFEGR